MLLKKTADGSDAFAMIRDYPGVVGVHFMQSAASNGRCRRPDVVDRAPDEQVGIAPALRNADDREFDGGTPAIDRQDVQGFFPLG